MVSNKQKIIHRYSMSLQFTPLTKCRKGQDTDRTTVSITAPRERSRKSPSQRVTDFQIFDRPSIGKNQHYNSRMMSIKLKHQSRINRRRTIREILGKMILRKAIVNKRIIQKIHSLPEKYKEKSQISSKINSDKKLTVSTSLVNTLKQNENHQICIESNITVYPYEEYSMKDQSRAVIIFLENLQIKKIKNLLKKFSLNMRKVALLRAYFAKVIRNFNLHCHAFIKRLRVINIIQHKQILETKRKIMRNCLNKCLERRDRIVLEGLKSSNQELNAKKAEYIGKLQALTIKTKRNTFYLLKYYSELGNFYYEMNGRKDNSDQSEDYRKTRVSMTEQIEQGGLKGKILVLQKTIDKCFCKVPMKKLIRLKDKRNWYRLTAQKIACNPKITVFRSFCRLRINARIESNRIP